MALKKKKCITDRVTAAKAKTFIYGNKEKKRLAATSTTNLYITECMTCVPPEPAHRTVTAASKNYYLTFSFWGMSVFVLCTVFVYALYIVFVYALVFNYRF